MSEDRTQAPSKQRREMARERGQVAHSPELTGAAGLLAATAALWAWGDGLAAALLAAVRSPLTDALPASADAAEVVARLRHLALGVAWPLLAVPAAAAVAALAAHQAQVRGLWAPGLLAPDPSRLWGPGGGPDLAARAGRGAWGLAKAAVVVAAAAWVLHSDAPAFPRLGGLDAPDLARACGRLMRSLTLVLAAATVVLGLVDFALRHARLEAALRLSPEEHREDLRSAEGDPALRGRRRRLARSLRGDDEAAQLVGASLLVTGPAGLAVVLAGGPPPGRVTVRTIVSGASGDRLRRAASASGLPHADSPPLAFRLARRRPPTLPLTPELLAELAPLWPAAAPARRP